MTKAAATITPPKSSKAATELEAARDQLTYGLESLLVDMATDNWVAGLKPQDLKNEVLVALAGMLLGYTVRARNLHAQMLELASKQGQVK